MKEIIDTSEKILNKSVKVVETNPDQISIRNPSNLKAKKLLGWKPKIDLLTSLKSIQPYV